MDYGSIGLDNNLQPINSPVTSYSGISAYNFDSNNERGAVTSSFLAGIRTIDGTIIVNKYGLTNNNFPSSSGSDADGVSGYSSNSWGTLGTVALDLTNKNKNVNLLAYLYGDFQMNISPQDDGYVRITCEKSTDGTTYTADASTSAQQVDDDTVENKNIGISHVFSLSPISGTNTYKYWRIIAEGSISGTTAAMYYDYTLGYVALGA
jgi:hypothetical protein